VPSGRLSIHIDGLFIFAFPFIPGRRERLGGARAGAGAARAGAARVRQ